MIHFTGPDDKRKIMFAMMSISKVSVEQECNILSVFTAHILLTTIQGCRTIAQVYIQMDILQVILDIIGFYIYRSYANIFITFSK